MPPKTTIENCELCHEHSGITTYLKGIAFLVTLATGLLAYSVMWQAPALKASINDVKRDAENSADKLNRRVDIIEKDIMGLDERISKLE